MDIESEVEINNDILSPNAKEEDSENAENWLRKKTSRRAFLSTASTAGFVATLGLSGITSSHSSIIERLSNDGISSGLTKTTLKVNGQSYQLNIDPRTTLLDALRDHVHLTGTKKGCDHGQCGACTVHVNGKRINSCLSLALMHEGDEITTIEGLGTSSNMSLMQEAFVECDGYQCGYCTGGQIMSATAMLKENWGTSDEDVKVAMSGNICRCGAYENIVQAIQQAREKAVNSGTQGQA